MRSHFLTCSHSLFFLLLLAIACSQKKRTPFPLNETEYAPPVNVRLDKPEIRYIPDSVKTGLWIENIKTKKIERRHDSDALFPSQQIPIGKPVINIDTFVNVRPCLPPYKIKKSNSSFISQKSSISNQIPLPPNAEVRNIIPRYVSCTNPLIKSAGLPRRPDAALKNLRYLSQDQGLPGTVVNCLLLDSYNRLWIGTENGLVVFDGVNMLIYSTAQGLSNNYIWSLLEDNQKRIWIGTYGGGVNVWDGNQWSIYSTTQGLSNNDVRCLLEDSQKRIWIGTYGGGINVWNESRLNIYGIAQGISDNHISSLLEDHQKRVWIGTYGGGVNIWDGNQWSIYSITHGLSNNDIRCLLEDSQKKIWIGTSGGGINVWDGSNWNVYDSVQGLINNDVRCLLEDHQKRIWIGTDRGGINLLDGNYWIKYNSANGLSNNEVRSLLEDNQKRIWIGTYGGGVNLFDGNQWSVYGTNQGLSNKTVMSLLEDNQNRIWIGTYGGGINLWEGSHLRLFTTSQGISNNSVMCFLEDSQKRIWVGTSGGGVNVWDGIHWSVYSTAQGLSNNDVRSLLEDSQKRVWVGTSGGGVNVWDGNCWSIYSTDQGLSNNDIRCLLEDSRNRIWIGTFGGGINVFVPNKNFELLKFTTDQGLSDNAIILLSEDSAGYIYAGTGNGLTVFTSIYDYPAIVARYGKNDGLPFIDFNDGNGGRGLVTRKDRKLWGTGIVLTVLEPDTQMDTIRASVYITRIDRMEKELVLGKINNDIRYKGVTAPSPYNIPTNLSLSYDSDHLSIHYTASGLFSEMHDIRYRYILERDDWFGSSQPAWSPISVEHKTDYRNLSPGAYTFRVAARGRNGLWSDPAEFSFEIRPPWWKSRAYYIIQFLVVMLMFTAALFFSRRKTEKNLKIAYIIITLALLFVFEYGQDLLEDYFSSLLGNIIILKIGLGLGMAALLVPMQGWVRKFLRMREAEMILRERKRELALRRIGMKGDLEQVLKENRKLKTENERVKQKIEETEAEIKQLKNENKHLKESGF